ncbi:flagellar basal-body rod protein FlgF [Planomicrobium sp. CPCC 101110]|uniref:flagellar basal-body rod protein FlgF n=1 Tax=Planomicrobium sp. CPCC 101110 TaxID=2599619 RepID=UPI0011B51734|nr:flagellar basal-body rod protein FlgF [Planomicrobium sp. CPCC 101110]TWT27831.1 flagellar basal-body rod protein FlgF [Planomicrobium sp. CPCC 101110]
MLRSMYSGVSGMKGFQTKLDVIGNNISNVNTVGFKKSTINFQDLLSQNMSSNGVNPMQVGLGTQTSSISTVHTAGSSMTTGVGTDLSIQGDGFFVVEDAQGDQFLTRAGNFLVDADGDLVTTQGHSVLDGAGNAINIPMDTYSSFAIDPQGRVIGKRADNGTEVTIQTIGISNPENPAGLRKVGGSLYEMTASASPDGINTGTAATRNTQIASGMLEMSNVDLTEEFTELIIAQRGFQANSRTITTSDEILQEVVNLKR